MKSIIPKISFSLVVMFFSFFNFTQAENEYLNEIVCGIVDIRCIAKKIVKFGNTFVSFSEDKVKNISTEIIDNNDYTKPAALTTTNLNDEQDSHSTEEQNLSDVDHHAENHNHESEDTEDSTAKISNDDSFLCKIGLFCSDNKNESLREADPLNQSVPHPDEIVSNLESIDPTNSDYSDRSDSFYASTEYQALGNLIENDGDKVYGQELPPKDLDQSKIDGAFIDPGSGDCGNYGITLSGSNSSRYPASTLSSKIKQDTKRLCSLTGKKLHVTSGRRGGLAESNSCLNQSQHNCGHAMDTKFDPFKTDEEKTIAMLFFMSRGYNGIGSYGASVPIHIDHRNGPMRWGPGPGKGNYRLMYCATRHWPNYAKQAFLRSKVEPCQLISTNILSANAKAALIQMGKPQFAE